MQSHLLARVRQIAAERTEGMIGTTFDPKGPGVARIFLIPLKPGLKPRDSLLLINQWTVSVSSSWARLLRIFIEELNEKATPGKEIDTETLSVVTAGTALRMGRFYPKTPRETFESDLRELVNIILAVARGQEVPNGVFQGTTLADNAKFLRAPLRMDLMVSSLRSASKRACPLNCGICYGKDQELMGVEPMPYSDWIQVVRILGRIGVPDITYTGGEPLVNKHIVGLVEFSQSHTTRINTSGVPLTADMARQLYQANLDGIQITCYSNTPFIHDQLVGRPGAWGMTISGIKHALDAGLLTSINTPILRQNWNYANTLRFFSSLGIRYVTCSGLIPAGGAQLTLDNAVIRDELYEIVAKAVETAHELEMEINFTSPGALTDEQLHKLGLQIPICGAGLENMAVSPGGQVVGCQSALGEKDKLGHILNDEWHHIWDSRKCREMRKRSAGKNACPLGGDR